MSAPVEVGETIGGKYLVERLLGQGAMGVVFAARHLQLGEPVALKFMLPDAQQDEQAVRRFQREARAAVRLKSEHVARVLDVGALDSGVPYIVMEHLEGFDLGECLGRSGPMPVAEVADYVFQACQAIAEAHALGIVHRDLKPTNLFRVTRVDGSPLIKVLDFGVSKIQSSDGAASFSMTQTGALVGSPAYMAPEQMNGSKVGPAADIWALGVILYQLVSGRLPFSGASLPELCLRVLDDEPAPLAGLVGTLPTGFEAIVRRCLAKRPGDRPASAADLADALAPYTRPTARYSTRKRAVSVSGGEAAPAASGSPSGGAGSGDMYRSTLRSSVAEVQSDVRTSSRRRTAYLAAAAGLGGAAILVAVVSSWGGRSGPTREAAGPASGAVQGARPAPSEVALPAPARVLPAVTPLEAAESRSASSGGGVSAGATPGESVAALPSRPDAPRKAAGKPAFRPTPKRNRTPKAAKETAEDVFESRR